MANTKISALPAVTVPAATDEIPVNQGGTTKKLGLDTMLGIIPGNVTMGSATVDGGVFSIIKGATASDPTFSITQAATAVTLAETVGGIIFTSAADITLTATGGDILLTGAVGLTSIAGNTLYVGPGCTYTTIGAAMTAAAANDTILVTEGTYTETVTFSQDNLTLRAIGAAENTIITPAVNTTAVSFAAKSGCTLDGFTTNLTDVDANTDYNIYSNNDSTTDYNIVENCIVNSTFDVAAEVTAVVRGIYFADGNGIARNNRVTISNAYTSGSTLSGIAGDGAHTYYFDGNIVSVTSNSTGTTDCTAVQSSTSSTSYITNNNITITADVVTTGDTRGIRLLGTNAYVNGNVVTATSTDTGTAAAITISSGTGYINGNELNATTGDGDGKWLDNSATVYATGNIVTGDMAITPGTWNGLTQASAEVLTATNAGVSASLLTDITICITDTGGGVEATNVALADGTLGQTKIFTFKTEEDAGDTVIITPTTPVGFATVTFDAVGDSCSMVFDGTSWMLTGLGNGNATVG